MGEALLLGFVLALDSMGAGLAAALAEYFLIITCLLVGLFTLCTFSLGYRIGQRVNFPLDSWADFAPGVLLVLLGVWQLI